MKVSHTKTPLKSLVALFVMTSRDHVRRGSYDLMRERPLPLAITLASLLVESCGRRDRTFIIFLVTAIDLTVPMLILSGLVKKVI